MAGRLVRDTTIKMLEVNPSLSYAEIGRLLGVSRERIRQVAGKGKRHPKGCKVCGKRLRVGQNGVTQTAYQQRLCSDCWKSQKEKRKKARQVVFNCEVCGEPFTRDISVVRRQWNRGQQVRWCGRQCQGRWLSANFGQN